MRPQHSAARPGQRVRTPGSTPGRDWGTGQCCARQACPHPSRGPHASHTAPRTRGGLGCAGALAAPPPDEHKPAVTQVGGRQAALRQNKKQL